MSHAAIAAVLALDDVSLGERLAAFSLASFANREQRAWPGTRIAAARAGLSKSQYLAARQGLVRRGLVELEHAGGGRGRSPVIALCFAVEGPWVEDEINAPLVEAVLGRSRAHGSSRLLLATMAALADEQMVVSGLAGECIRWATGMADSTYRRARGRLVSDGELVLQTEGGGRGHTNRWVIADPRALNPHPNAARESRPAARRAGKRPLVAAVPAPAANGPDPSTLSAEIPARARTVSPADGRQVRRLRPANPGQSQTDSPTTPPQTPPETPPLHVRAGMEAQNPRIQKDPPNPPQGGSTPGHVRIEQSYLTDSGRRRRRMVPVEITQIRDGFQRPGSDTQAAWSAIRTTLVQAVGESTFEIWLAGLQLVAVDRDGTLVVSGPSDLRAWVNQRFGVALASCAARAGQSLRLAQDFERAALEAHPEPPAVERRQELDIQHKEAS